MPTTLFEIDALKKQLSSLLPMKPEDQLRLDKKFRLEFSYNSNHLEGNTLTYGETELLLIFGETKGNHDKREYDEMEAHDMAYAMIQEWAAEKERPLTEMDIKNLNKIILVKPFWKDAITPDGQATRRQIKIGDYKDQPNSVRLQNGEMFHYASPAETPIKMGELIAWYREEEEKKELHPVALAAMLHYRFVCIHPFDDGNGRISRLLVNYVLLRNEFPPIVIKSADKKNYLHALHQADAGFLNEFVEYVTEQSKWSLDISVRAAKGESIDEIGDFEKKVHLLKQKTGLTGEILLERNKQVVVSTYLNGIHDFLIKIIVVLQKLESFFKSKRNEISVYTSGNFENNLWEVNDIEEVIKIMKNNETLAISLNCTLGQLRKNKKDFSLKVNIEVQFHELVYEIKSNEIDIEVDKQYNESLTKQEIQLLTEKAGNILFEKIDAALKD